MNFCIKCGNPLKPTARFCGKCGEILTQVDQPVQPEPVAAPVCSSCGSAIIPGVKFCTSCGAIVTGRMSGSSENVPPQPVKPVKPAPQVKQKIAQKLRKEDKKPRKKSVAGLLKIAASLILIAGLGTVAWFFIFKSSSSADVVYPEYTSHQVVTGETTTESKKINLLGGSDARIVLSDSSSVFIPGLKSNASIELKKENNNIVLIKPGLKTSGYMLSLSFRGNDSLNTLRPVITIPRSQVGDVNPITINIVRVSDILCPDGSIIRNQPRCLPVTIDKSGNYMAIDYMFPNTAATLNTTAQAGDILTRFMRVLIPAACAEEKYHESMGWISNVKYSIMTFQGDVNWLKNPRLVQMIPDQRTGHFRHPATQPERFKRTAPVINVVVLVHGHNEEEKGGNVESSTKDLWEFDYKRDVWNYMYKFYLDQSLKTATADPNKNDSCTVFYEFIYPSYRPAYTPVPFNSIRPYRTLGQDLGEALNDELIKNNPQTAAMIKNNIPFNLFIVAHSMGGLVARAGIRFLDNRIIGNFRQLITWGTPHQGSPLTTLRYIAAAGFDVKLDDMPFFNFGNAPADAMEGFAMDTPGTRDLRWTNGSHGEKNFFKFDSFFRERTVEQCEGPEWDLRSGSKFFNDNLKTFNEREQYAGKYTFLTGSTSKTAGVEKCTYKFTWVYYFKNSPPINQGATLLSIFADNPAYKPNDGASPVYSQSGMGLTPNPKSISMGDVDHQQFYEDDGEETAAKTFEVMKDISNCDCPTLSDLKTNKDKVDATLVLPSDPKPGERIDKITVAIYDPELKKSINQSSDFTVTNSKGGFSGTYKLDKKYASRRDLTLKIVCKDGSILEYPCSEINWNVYNKIEITCLLDHGNVRSVWQKLKEPENIVEKTDEDGSVMMSFANGGSDKSSILIPIKWVGNHFEVNAVYPDGVLLCETTIKGEITAMPLTKKTGSDKEVPSKDPNGLMGYESPHKMSGNATKILTTIEGYETIESLNFVNIPFTVIYYNDAIFANENAEDYIVGRYVTDIKKEEHGPESIEKISCSSAKGVIQIYLKIK